MASSVPAPLLLAVKSTQNTLHHLRRGRRMRCDGPTQRGGRDGLEQEALLGVDWGCRVCRNLGFCEELSGCFAEATFVAVIVNVDVEPRKRVSLVDDEGEDERGRTFCRPPRTGQRKTEGRVGRGTSILVVRQPCGGGRGGGAVRGREEGRASGDGRCAKIAGVPKALQCTTDGKLRIVTDFGCAQPTNTLKKKKKDHRIIPAHATPAHPTTSPPPFPNYAHPPEQRGFPGALPFDANHVSALCWRYVNRPRVPAS